MQKSLTCISDHSLREHLAIIEGTTQSKLSSRQRTQHFLVRLRIQEIRKCSGENDSAVLEWHEIIGAYEKQTYSIDKVGTDIIVQE
jgi:hypothetical protein